MISRNMISSFICSRSSVCTTSFMRLFSIVNHSFTRSDLPGLTRNRESSTFISYIPLSVPPWRRSAVCSAWLGRLGWTLKTEFVAIWILHKNLLHAIERNLRRGEMHTASRQLGVNGASIVAYEEEADTAP